MYRPDSELMARPGADLRMRSAVLLLAAVGGAVVLAVSSEGRSERTGVAAAPASGPTVTLMAMNLCLSGLAGCYGRVAYPAVVQEAAARIDEANPDAVAFNEACEGD